MSKLVFYPEGSERGFFWMHVWFHGLAALYSEGDMVRANLDIKYVRDGTHLVKLRNPRGLYDGELFLWSFDMPGTGQPMFQRRGLIVLLDDPKAVTYATDHYHTKSRSL